MVKKVVVALGITLVVQSLLVLCLVSAEQIQVPRNMPFGVVGSSQIVRTVKSTTSLDTITYPNKSAAMTAIDQSQLYGAYVAGSPKGTLIVVSAKSFFAQVELEAAFGSAGQKLKTPFTVQTVKPLPQSDRTGAVVGLLLLPLLIGGYLASVLVFKATSTAAAPWRAAILTGYAIVGALLTDLLAGPLIGAYSGAHFWPLLPCFALITTAVALAAAAIQGLVGRLGSLLVVILFIVLGLPSDGAGGPALLPTYWQYIGAVLPPRSAVNLIRNVLYFGGNNITTPLIVLFLWLLAGMAVIGFLGRLRPARMAAAKRSAAATTAPAPKSLGAAAAPDSPGAAPAPESPRSKALSKAVLAALVIVAFMECLIAFNYTDSGHEPIATNMPFGVIGSSPILTQVEKTYSLQVTRYPNASAVKTAIGQAKLYGALEPGSPASTLITVPSASDLAPLDLAVQFENAAKSLKMQLKVQNYAPVPLPKKDPFGIVPALMLIPLLIGGYICSTNLLAATGKPERWRGFVLAGFAIVAGLVVDLIVCLWLQGYATDKFWIVWPIAALIIVVTALVAAVLQKLIGAAGTLLTVIVVMLFGNPSNGGATGVPYLSTFWRDIGPYLPPRNAYILLHNTIYFHGNGITQALVALLLYAGIAAVILGLLEWVPNPTPPSPVTPETEAEATAMVIPIAPP
jgi:hypothetical protein